MNEVPISPHSPASIEFSPGRMVIGQILVNYVFLAAFVVAAAFSFWDAHRMLVASATLGLFVLSAVLLGWRLWWESLPLLLDTKRRLLYRGSRTFPLDAGSFSVLRPNWWPIFSFIFHAEGVDTVVANVNSSRVEGITEALQLAGAEVVKHDAISAQVLFGQAFARPILSGGQLQKEGDGPTLAGWRKLLANAVYVFSGFLGFLLILLGAVALHWRSELETSLPSLLLFLALFGVIGCVVAYRGLIGRRVSQRPLAILLGVMFVVGGGINWVDDVSFILTLTHSNWGDVLRSLILEEPSFAWTGFGIALICYGVFSRRLAPPSSPTTGEDQS